jgi:hypothetical protein
MIEPETQMFRAVAKKESSIPKFMKHSGSIQGPPDLSSRRGFSRIVVEKFVEEKLRSSP